MKFTSTNCELIYFETEGIVISNGYSLFPCNVIADCFASFFQKL